MKMTMAAEVRWLSCIFLISFLVSHINGSLPHRRFEYKYSFKSPYLAQRGGGVPFFEYGGNAIASSENVRIAPSLRSQKGAIWTKAPTNFDWWEIDIAFRITGRGRVGADGLAFWYTLNKGSYDGEVFGSSDKWNGLAVFFDSFDNDNKHNNPYIMAVLNDGTREFDHQNDGSTQLLAGCLRDFRNKPFPTRARIEYYQNTLTVLFNNGMTENDQEFEMCLRAENVVLPKFGYFGLSAATGGLADDHDVIHFLTTSLHPPGQQPSSQTQGLTEEDQRKLTQEYADYQRKAEEEREKYRRENPAAAHPVEEFYETDSERELKQIFQGQSKIHEVVRDLNRKLDEVIGRQERTLSVISSIQSGGGVPVVTQQHGQPGQAPVQMIDTIRRHEVDAVLQNQNSMITIARDLVGFITDIRTRADTIIANQARQPTAQVQSVGYDMAALVNELRDNINIVKRDVAAATRLGGGSAGGAANQNCPTCLTPTMFFIFAAIQVFVIVAYSMYKDSREAQAKKFF